MPVNSGEYEDEPDNVAEYENVTRHPYNNKVFCWIGKQYMIFM